MAKPKLPKKLYVVSYGEDVKWDTSLYSTLKECKEYREEGDRIGVYELVKEVTNPKG